MTAAGAASQGGGQYEIRAMSTAEILDAGFQPVSYTHLTLPTTPYV